MIFLSQFHQLFHWLANPTLLLTQACSRSYYYGLGYKGFSRESQNANEVSKIDDDEYTEGSTKLQWVAMTVRSDHVFTQFTTSPSVTRLCSRSPFSPVQYQCAFEDICSLWLRSNMKMVVSHSVLSKDRSTIFDRHDFINGSRGRQKRKIIRVGGLSELFKKVDAHLH